MFATLVWGFFFFGVFFSHLDNVFTPVRCIGTNSNQAVL